MKRVYVAANGDGVGEQIGNAILSDDHQALSGLSRKFKDAHSNIEKWAQKKGGEIVASAGDEIIFSLPEEALGELDSVKDAYSQSSGTTLTMGIGETISQASKALIYGKLNDKNQIVEYEPQMDDYISDDEAEEEIPTPEDIDDSASEESHFQEGVDNEDEMDDDQDEDQDENLQEEPEEDSDEEQDSDSNVFSDEEDSDEDFANQDDFSEEDESDEDNQVEIPEDQIDGDYGSEEMEEGQPEHEKRMGEEEEFIHDAQENREDEADDDNIEADEEEGVLGHKTGPSIGEDEEESDEDEEFGDEDIPELSDEDLATAEDQGQIGDEELPEDSDEQVEGSDADGFLNEMMHSNIDEDQQDQDMSQDPETQELKEKIFSALQSLKQNKEMLDQIQAQNPDLYQGIIANIQSMIEMGRKLGMEPQSEEQEMGDSELDQNAEPNPYGAYEQEVPVKKPQGGFQA